MEACRCKRIVRITLCLGDLGCTKVRGHLHPRGCCKASRTHVDIPIANDPVTRALYELGFRRGMHLDVSSRGADWFEAETPLGILRVEGVGTESRRVYVKVVRGRIYLGL